MSDKPFDTIADDGIPVTLPSGASFYVLTEDEKDYLEERVTRYTSDNKFVNVSDMQDVDKMVTMELFMHRNALWAGRGIDYFNDPVDGAKLRRENLETSGELRQLKKQLGIDKVARDKATGDESIAAYHDALLRRAKAFGLHRNAQFGRCMEAFQEMSAWLTYYDNCDEFERQEQKMQEPDLIRILREKIKWFEELDETFRKEEQQMWVRKQ